MTIAFDGTDFCGWQVQSGERTVQGEVQRVLSTISDKLVKVTGSSRTDSGVHAIGMVANAYLNDFTPDDLKYRLNSMLPGDIAIRKIERVAEDFHARYSASGKRYEYRIIFDKNPHRRNYALLLYKKPKIEILQRAARFIKGEHDFTAFARLKELPDTPNCRITRAEWFESEREFKFAIEGNRFLYTMVRSLVGAMLDCARGRFGIGQFSEMIESGARLHDYRVAPAHGLWLIEVFYP